MKKALLMAIIACGMVCSACVASTEDPTPEEVASTQEAVTPAQYCSTLAMIIKYNWSTSTPDQQAAMAAAWGTNCSPLPGQE